MAPAHQKTAIADFGGFALWKHSSYDPKAWCSVLLFDWICSVSLIFLALGIETSFATTCILWTLAGILIRRGIVRNSQVLSFAGIGLPGFGLKARFILYSNDHKAQTLSNPEKCCRNIQCLHHHKHVLDCTQRIKCGFTTNTGQPRLFCFLFQLQGKGSAQRHERKKIKWINNFAFR